MLCESAGLDCKIVLSDTHAWNLVKIDGSWYHVDCTWDDTGNDTNGKWEYFLLGDDAISSFSDHHSFWGTSSTPLPAASSAFDSCGWRTNLGSTYYDLHGTILHDGAFYFVRGDVDATTELVKWTPNSEDVLARGSADEEDSTAIRDVVEFDGSIYYIQGNRAYRLNGQGDDNQLYEDAKWGHLGGFYIEGNQLLAMPPTGPGGHSAATAQHLASCEHEYSAQMKPATANQSGYFIDTCSICGDVHTYSILAASGGPASTGGSSQEQGGEGTASDENGSSVLPGSETGEDPSIEPSPGAEQDAPTESVPAQQAAKPGKVKGAKASSRKGAVTLSWSKVKGASGYTVAFKTGLGAWKYTSASVKASSKTIAKLRRGKVYQLKVRALSKSAGKTLAGTWSKTLKIRVR